MGGLLWTVGDGFLGAMAAAPSPTPTPTGPPADQVTPGFGGFAVIALITLAVFLLGWDVQRRIRRVRYRAEVAEQLDAEQAAAAAGAESADGPVVPGEDPADPETAPGTAPGATGPGR